MRTKYFPQGAHMLKKFSYLFISNLGLKFNSLIFSFIIAHWQGASFLGAMFIFLSVHSFGLVLAKLGLFYSLEKKLSEVNIDKNKYISSAFAINIALLAFLLLILIIFSPYLDSYIGINNATVALGFSVLFGNFINFGYAIFKSNLQFELFSKLQFFRDFLFRALSIILLFYTSSIEVVLISKVMVELILLIYTVIKVSKYNLSWSSPSKAIIKELIELLRYNSVLEIRTVTFNYIDIWMINFFLGDFYVGLYQLVWQISTGVLIVGKALIGVTFPYFSRWSSEGKYDKISKYTGFTIKLSLFMPLPTLFLSLTYSNEIMSFFGEEFIRASIVLIILLFGSLFRPLQEITSKLLVSTGKAKISYRISVFSGLLNIALNFILILLLHIEGAALATTLSNIIIASISIFYIKKHSPIEFKAFKAVKSNVMASIIMLLTIYSLQYFNFFWIVGSIIGLIMWLTVIMVIEKREGSENVYDFITRSLRK